VEFDTYWQNGGYKKISDIIFAECHIFIVSNLCLGPGDGSQSRYIYRVITSVPTFFVRVLGKLLDACIPLDDGLL
jgi:hypothetical protein